ncbi:WXG100 family type VII secretion target [Amycolatopsis sp. EV170708-02-1]|uniref:WXG100 family type VII secretion target n=1 Tax=Amycolatopsis sp. EV170708-02-1 TaxID=2919322 RepID=UPI001F0C2F70|nr:WXG100 family type VII secretion target [Amycolatopsis sp. EV170708-02-1]UMP06957.1 WXG100 family type VII secretion target [Amycolatopsis sp. EV170708-02-1]
MPELSTQVPGAYNSSAPPMNVAQYSNWDQIGAAVGDITTGGSLSKSTQADAWYEFATKVGNAAKQLGDVNSKIATEIKAVRESLKGEAGEAFDKYATGLFKKSEELYQTLSGKDYPGNVGVSGMRSGLSRQRGGTRSKSRISSGLRQPRS